MKDKPRYPGIRVTANGNQLVGWNYTTGTRTFEITDPHGIFGEFHLAASLKGNYVLSSGRDLTLRVWDVTTGKEATQWKLEWKSDGIAVSHDGKFAAVWHNAANKVSLHVFRFCRRSVVGPSSDVEVVCARGEVLVRDQRRIPGDLGE